MPTSKCFYVKQLWDEIFILQALDYREEKSPDDKCSGGC